MSTMHLARGFTLILAGTLIFVLILTKGSNDNVVLRADSVVSSRVLLVDQILLLKFELELVLSVGLNVDVSFTM